MKKTNSKFGVLFIIIVLLHACLAEKTSVNQNVFEKKYSCDSIISPTYDFIFEDDSAVYSPVKKEPFDFKLRITKDYIKINNTKYYYILGGLNIDTLGLVAFIGETYLYRQNKSSSKCTILFNFNKELKESWQIKEGGYFNNYEFVLDDIKDSKALKDTVYSFSYTFLGQKFPNGYYLKYFDVSKQYGILSFNFTNGVKCDCIKN